MIFIKLILVNSLIEFVDENNVGILIKRIIANGNK